MNLNRSQRVAPRVEWRDAVGSTNAELSALVVDAPGAWPHLSVLVTDTQTEGRGRLGRSWSAPAGTSMAASVLLDLVAGPRAVPQERWGWIPLLAGAAMTRALRELFDDPARVSLKWPNDVLIDNRKVCGILSELTPAGIVVGSGVNLTMAEHELPTDTATSLAIAGARTTELDEILAGYLGHLAPFMSSLASASGDSLTALTDAVRGLCSTVGATVRVDVPAKPAVSGRALDIDELGRLVIEISKNRPHLVVAAGDVTHVRVIMSHDSSTRDGPHSGSG
jgi:BirA family biotin operon repressor/biotin-[acetyl-CoA-carboxylase] ligase